MIKKSWVGAIILSAVACNNLDPYAEKWPQIEIADSRSRAIEVMGSPTTVNSIEVPLVRAEQLTWKSSANQRVYILTIVMNRVAAKTIVQ